MGKMNFYNATPEFILRTNAWRVSVAVDSAARALSEAPAGDTSAFVPANDKDVVLVFRANEVTESVRMTRGADYAANSRNLALYFASVPCESFESADKVRYHFECEGEVSRTYEVEVASAGQMPPVIVTELYARPKNGGLLQFFELTNPSAVPTDLYNYKLMAYSGATPTSNNYICSLYLSEKPGDEVLHSGESAAIWPLMPAHHKLADPKMLTPDGFSELAMAEFPKPAFDLAETKFRLIPVEASRIDETSGAYVPLERFNLLPIKTETTTLIVAPREAQPENGLDMSVFSMVYNIYDDGRRDTPVKYSSLWTIDVRRPSVGVNVAHRALMTPGVLDRGQAIPVLGRECPAIVPLDADVTIKGEGEVTCLSFAIDGYVADAFIELRLADGRLRRYNAYENDGVWRVDLPARDIFMLTKLCYTFTVYDGVRRTVLGSYSEPLTTRLHDLRGPRIIHAFPETGYCFDDTRTPELSVRFGDALGVNLSASVLCVDRKNVTAQAHWEVERVTYTPARPLRYGAHSYEIMLCDKQGNKTYRKIEFSVCRAYEMNLYRGEIHAHTAFSDGTATPLEAMKYARDVGGVDFFAVTEHSHYTDMELYRRQIEIADELDEPGRFAALYGFEMTWNNTCALWGHMNVLGTQWMDEDIHNHGIHELYEQLRRDPKAVAMFNHPCLAWGNFHDFDDYSPDADRAVCLSEIKGANYDREYANLLTRGWHASPTYSEDNHSYDWTTATQSTTYVLAPALTRENILDAFRRRRTYSTGDPTMKIRFKINGAWMGSRITTKEKLRVEADVLTECEAGIGTIELVGEDNIVVASVNVGALQSFKWRLGVPCEYDYYYLRITSPGKYTVTSPVWIENPSPLCLSPLEHRSNGGDYRPHTVSTKIKNTADAAARDIEVDFYLTPITGFDSERTVPYRTVRLPVLPAGSVANVSCEFPDVAGMRRLSVVVRGSVGRSRFTETEYVVLSPLAITEILTKSSETVDREGKTVKNPFKYFRLYNMSGRDICLDGFAARLWVKTGKQPVEANILRFSGQTVKAGKSLTVWVRPAGAALEVEDFDRRYGAMLTEGEDIMISDVAVLDNSGDMRRLDIMLDKEMLTRCEYDDKQYPGSDLHTDRAMTFSPDPTFTGKQSMTANDALPSFGACRGDKQ